MRPQIIVIGGSGRIGKAFCSLIDSKNDFEIINIDPFIPQANKSKKNKILNIEFKLDSLNSAKKILKIIIEKYKEINIKAIVNLSRTLIPKKEFLIEEKIIVENINSQITGIGYLIHLMIKRKILSDCSIVHMGSLNAHQVSHQPVIYHYFKGAIESASKALAYKLAKYNVRSNVVIAGLVSDPSFKLEEKKQEIQIKSIPLKSGPPSIIDISNLIFFLISDDSKSITGTSIVIDSGMSLPDNYHIVSNLI